MTKEIEQNENSNKTTYDHVIKYTGLFGGVQGITMLMGIVRNKIVAMLLGPEGMGLINIFSNIIKLISHSTNFGLEFSAVKHMAEMNEKEDRKATEHFASVVRTWCLAVGLFGTLVCIILSKVISFSTFGNYDQTLSFIILSPAIAFLSISGGELAILKGTKELKKVAIASVIASISALFICVPIYYYMGIDGVALSLLLTFGAVTLIQIYYSRKVIPWHTSLFVKNTYTEGFPMIKLGIGYIIAGIFGQGADYIIRVLILKYGSLEDVGFYNSGYVMAVSYASLVFIAIEADFFPRLTGVKDDIKSQNETVNQQIEVCAVLISPFLVLFVSALPIIVVVLFSDKFINAVPIATCASFFMFFKALTLPAAYLSLAHGDSKMYMITELIYDIFIAIAIPIAYITWGLIGAGFALSIAGLIDALMIHTLYRRCYKYIFSTRLLHFYIIQFVILSSVVWASFQSNDIIHYIVDAIAIILSVGLSLRILRKETTFTDKIISKFKKK